MEVEHATKVVHLEDIIVHLENGEPRMLTLSLFSKSTGLTKDVEISCKPYYSWIID